MHKMCPCSVWLFFYRLFGNYLYYHRHIDSRLNLRICLPCKMAIKGHGYGGKCEFCGEER